MFGREKGSMSSKQRTQEYLPRLLHNLMRSFTLTMNFLKFLSCLLSAFLRASEAGMRSLHNSHIFTLHIFHSSFLGISPLPWSYCTTEGATCQLLFHSPLRKVLLVSTSLQAILSTFTVKGTPFFSMVMASFPQFLGTTRKPLLLACRMEQWRLSFIVQP